MSQKPRAGKSRDSNDEYCEVLLRVQERCDELGVSFSETMKQLARGWLDEVGGPERKDME